MSVETNEHIERLLAAYPDDVDVGEPYDDAVLADAERVLDVRLPPSYRDFLRRYGVLGLGATEVYGLTPADRDRGAGQSGVPSAVWFTLRRRASGALPRRLVVLVNFDGVEYACLDTESVGDDKECPVVIWSVPAGAVVARPARSFDEYLQTLLNEFETTVAEV